MKNWRRVLLAAAFAAFCMAFLCAFAEENGAETSSFVMPASLRVIDESAFENTEPEEIVLPATLNYIGARAFAGSSRVRAVVIPSADTFISEDAFAGRKDIVVVGVHGSCAEDWARRNGDRFVRIEAWFAQRTDPARRGHLWLLLLALAVVLWDGLERFRWFFRSYFETRFTDPKNRPEFYPIEYDFP